MNWCWKIMVCLCCLLGTGQVMAGLQLERVASAPQNLSPHLAVLQDASLKLDLQSVQKAPYAQMFSHQFQYGDAVNLSYTKQAVWLRLQLHNPHPMAQRRLLEIANPNLNLVQFFQPDASGQYRTTTTGLLLPFTSREVLDRHFVFVVEIPAFSQQTVYLRVLANAVVLLPAKLWGEDEFYQHQRNEYVIQAWYFGMALAMILFNFLLYFSFRDPLYLQYVSFVFFMASALAIQNGLAKEFCWPDARDWADYARTSAYSLALVSLIQFERSILNTRQCLPRVDVGLRVLLLVLLLAPLAYAQALPMLVRYSVYLHIGGVLIVFCVSLVCILQRQRTALFFMLAFATLFVAAFANGLRNLALLPSNFLTMHALQLGSAIEMILLAFVLADRFNLMQRSKEKAQQQALQAQRQLLQKLQASEQELERRVSQRSAALEKINQDLVQANAELEAARVSAETALSQAEQARHQATQAMQDLQAMESQLVQAEKLAALGQMVSSIVQEIDAPLQEIRQHGMQVSQTMHELLQILPTQLQHMSAEHGQLFLDWIVHQAEQGEAVAAPSALLALPQAAAMRDCVAQIRCILQDAQAINQAALQVGKTIAALKNYAHFDPGHVLLQTDVQLGIETVLTIFQNQLTQGIQLQRDFTPTPTILCRPDELNQLWMVLIQLALQALAGSGVLRIAIYPHVAGVQVEIQHHYVPGEDAPGEAQILAQAHKIVQAHAGRLQIEVREQMRHICVWLPQL